MKILRVSCECTMNAFLRLAGNYGEKGYELLSKSIENEQHICVTFREKVQTTASDQVYDSMLKELSAIQPRPNVGRF